MSLPHALLGVLEARAMSGYELTRFFQAATGWVWSAPQSQIYPTLRSLEARGLVSAEESVRGRQLKRRVYSVTEAGALELRQWLVGPVEAASTRDPLFLRALFYDTIAEAPAVAAIQEHMGELRRSVKLWQDHRDRLAHKDTPLLRERLSRRDGREHDRMAALKAHAFQGLIDLATARIRWCEALVDLLAMEGAPETSPRPAAARAHRITPTSRG